MIDQQDSIQETSLNVAQQIRNLRNWRGLSQKELAQVSGLSRNTLSLIERGLTSPTISTLKRLALALEVGINTFFDPIDRVNIVYTKANQRLNLRLSQGLMADLGAGMREHFVTPLVLRLEPGARSGSPMAHDGQDFVYCVSGEVLYNVNNHAFILESGDSLLFDGMLQHRFQNTGISEAEILIVLTTPQDGKRYAERHFPDEATEDNLPTH